MIIAIDPADRNPPYHQVRVQVLAAIASGSLAPGSRLPTIRQLAADLDLATNTVARAYRELEADGAIETRGRKGTFVRQPAAVPAATARHRRLGDAARRWAEEASELGGTPGEAAVALARALADRPT